MTDYFRATKEQRQNLATLRDYLRNLPSDYTGFHMDTYVSYDGMAPNRPAKLRYIFPGEVAEEVKVEGQYPCGTCGCAVGHGPLAGIEPKNDTDNWRDYSEQAFTRSTVWWLYFFGVCWPDCPLSAAERIDRALNEKISLAEAQAAVERVSK
jgi:hypothetical protein